jgi:hypothetical protein
MIQSGRFDRNKSSIKFDKLSYRVQAMFKLLSAITVENSKAFVFSLTFVASTWIIFVRIWSSDNVHIKHFISLESLHAV